MNPDFPQRERVDSFGDILKSQWAHYFNWGGRTLCHSCTQFFIWVGKEYFDVANTLMLIALAFVILKLADLPFKKSAPAICWIFFNLFFVGEILAKTTVSMTWMTGATIYFWGTLFQLTFLLPYVQAIRGKKFFKPAIFAVIFGVLAGRSNESGILVTLFLTVIFIFVAKRQKTFQRWMAAGLASLAINGALNIFAPGNFARLQFSQSVNPNFQYTSDLFINNLLNGFLPTMAADFFAFLPVMYCLLKCAPKWEMPEFLMLIFAAAGLIVPCIMIFSPVFPVRAALISLIYVLAASTFAFAKINPPEKIKNFALAISFCYMALTICGYSAINENWQAHINYIKQHRSEDLIELKPLPPLPEIFSVLKAADLPLKYVGGISQNENSCINAMMAQYYGAKKIVGN